MAIRAPDGASKSQKVGDKIIVKNAFCGKFNLGVAVSVTTFTDVIAFLVSALQAS